MDNTFHANTVEGGVKIQKSEGIAFTGESSSRNEWMSQEANDFADGRSFTLVEANVNLCRCARRFYK